ncbi:MAG: divergent polysaccharide deacetylase family protein [Treponema sp.]|jgi:polysaccharide deacetylase 2 family uncharacterized protein YibQ|nr:divergent polysaccharide deacetylase family protein [Treponema sp.]
MKKTEKKKKISQKKMKKTGFLDKLRAFFLVGLIVAFSLGISLTIISIHSALNRESNIPKNDVTLDSFVPETVVTMLQTSSETEHITRIQQETPSAPIRQMIPGQQEPNRTPAALRPPATEDTRAVTPTVIPPYSPVENRGALVFVIDDAGNNLRELEPFLRIPYPLTIAVLPGLPHSVEAANRIRAAGKEVILHQPMESIGGQNPGPGAIYYGMSAEEIRGILLRNVEEVGPVTGINNHQGSRITMNNEAMRAILDFCIEHNLHFLDSRTTSESVVPAVAQQLGIQIAQRNVFIDNEQSRDVMLRHISGGLTGAQRSGSSVMIGHTWSPLLAPLLAEQFPLFVQQGFSLKTVSDILKTR